MSVPRATSWATGVSGSDGPYGLRAPPRSGSSEKWPPSVRDAERAFQEVTEEDRRGMRRSPRAVFALAGALAVRGLRQGRPADLVRATSIFLDCCQPSEDPRWARFRPAALLNASRCIEALPGASALALAGRLAREAVRAIADDVVARGERPLRDAVDRLLAASEDRSNLEPLIWGKPLQGSLEAWALVAKGSGGRDRIRGLPEVGVRGPWGSVREILADRGLLAPPSVPAGQACPASASLTATTATVAAPRQEPAHEPLVLAKPHGPARSFLKVALAGAEQ